MTYFEELRAEYESEVIGQLLYARITSIVRRLLERRDPRVYAQGAHSSDDALGDVTNAFIIADMINPSDPQIRYVMDVADSVEDIDRLIFRLAKRFLARTRVRTVVSNLVDRSKQRLREPPYSSRQSPTGEVFCLAGRDSPSHDASSEEIRHAVALARSVPTLRVTATERLPKMYDAEGLNAVLRILAETMTGAFALRDLEDFFDQLCTAWSTTLLELGERDETQSAPLSAEDLTVAHAIAEKSAASMTNDQGLIYLYFRAAVSDSVLADRMGASRQTIIARRKSLLAWLRPALEDLDQAAQHAALNELTVILAMRGLEP